MGYGPASRLLKRLCHSCINFWMRDDLNGEQTTSAAVTHFTSSCLRCLTHILKTQRHAQREAKRNYNVQVRIPFILFDCGLKFSFSLLIVISCLT